MTAVQESQSVGRMERSLEGGVKRILGGSMEEKRNWPQMNRMKSDEIR